MNFTEQKESGSLFLSVLAFLGGILVAFPWQLWKQIWTVRHLADH